MTALIGTVLVLGGLAISGWALGMFGGSQHALPLGNDTSIIVAILAVIAAVAGVVIIMAG